MTVEELRDRWRALATRLGCTRDVVACFELLRRHYARPGRDHHNLDHVAACLHVLDDVRDAAEDADSVETGLWFHDAVYTPGSSENEVLSAALAVNTLARMGAPPEVGREVHGLVLAASHRTPLERPDEKLIADVDLVILAADAPMRRGTTVTSARSASRPASSRTSSPSGVWRSSRRCSSARGSSRPSSSMAATKRRPARTCGGSGIGC